MKKLYAIVSLGLLASAPMIKSGLFEDIGKTVDTGISSTIDFLDPKTAKLEAKREALIKRYKNAVNASQRQAIRRELNAVEKQLGLQ